VGCTLAPREGNDTATVNEFALNYRKRFGYNKRSPLMSKELVNRFAQLHARDTRASDQ
jgi:hypothetical protein